MNQSTQLSIIGEYARGRGMEKEALVSTLLKVIAPPEATMEDLTAFVALAHRFDLDPFAGEIYMIRAKGKVKTFVGVDGYTKIVNRQPEYDGCEFRYDQDETGAIVACTCSMFRKDRGRPTVVTEFLSECQVPTSEAWRKAPGRMLRHRAFVQSARLTFGISGALDEGVDFTAPPIEAGSVNEPASPAEPPRPRRQPPSPSQRQERQEEGVTLAAKVTPQEAAFDLSGLLDAMAAAKTVEELKQIYNDYEVEDNLEANALDIAQNAFIAANKRITG